MTPRLPAGLIEAVTAAPDDDRPRLAAAEWLKGRGDPWGEFIVVQCALARSPEEDLLEREREWRKLHGAELEASLGVASSIAVFRRGFVECVGLSQREEVETAVRGLRGHPVRSVWIHGPNVDDQGDAAPADTLAGWFSTTCLEALSLTVDFTDGNHVSCAPDFFERLFASPRVRGVSSLDIGGELMISGELSMLSSPDTFPNLRTLQVDSSTSHPDDLLRAIVSSGRMQLRKLDLAAYCVDGTHDAMGVSPSIFASCALRLDRLSLGLAGSVDAAAWGRSPVLASLSTLHLHLAGDVDRASVRSLIDRAAHLERVTLFSWDEGWDTFVNELNRSSVQFEQPVTDWDWIAANVTVDADTVT